MSPEMKGPDGIFCSFVASKSADRQLWKILDSLIVGFWTHFLLLLSMLRQLGSISQQMLSSASWLELYYKHIYVAAPGMGCRWWSIHFGCVTPCYPAAFASTLQPGSNWIFQSLETELFLLSLPRLAWLCSQSLSKQLASSSWKMEWNARITWLVFGTDGENAVTQLMPDANSRRVKKSEAKNLIRQHFCPLFVGC